MWPCQIVTPVESAKLAILRRNGDNGDVAWWVQHQTVTPLTLVRLPGTARDFSPRLNFQCRLSYSVSTPPCAIACIYICVHVSCSPCQSSMVYGNTKTPNMYGRLESATLSQLPFHEKSNPNFPIAKSRRHSRLQLKKVTT